MTGKQTPKVELKLDGKKVPVKDLTIKVYKNGGFNIHKKGEAPVIEFVAKPTTDGVSFKDANTAVIRLGGKQVATVKRPTTKATSDWGRAGIFRSAINSKLWSLLEGKKEEKEASEEWGYRMNNSLIPPVSE